MFFNRGQAFAPTVRLCLNHADSTAIDEKHIVGRPGIGRIFPDGDSKGRIRVQRRLVLYQPTRRQQPLVDLIAGDLFGVLVDGLWHLHTNLFVFTTMTVRGLFFNPLSLTC